MNRTQKILTGVLVLQVLLIVLARGPLAQPMGAAAPHALLPALESFAPSQIVIQDGEGKKLTLRRGDNSWALEEFGGYPADTAKVDELLDKLKNVRVGRPVVTSGRYHEAMKVAPDDFERSLQIWDDPGKDPRASFYLGTSPNYRITHVRPADEDNVYEVTGLGTFDVRADANAWINTRFVDASLEQVEAFRLENASGRFNVEKDSDGKWIAVNSTGRRLRRLNASKVESLVRSLVSLWISDPVGKLDRAAQGFDHPATTVEIRLKAQTSEAHTETAEKNTAETPGTVTYWIGDIIKDNEDKRYIAREGFDFVALVSAGTVKTILEQKLSDLQ